MHNKFHSFSELFGERMAGAKRGETGHAYVSITYTKDQEILQDQNNVGLRSKRKKIRASAKLGYQTEEQHF